MVAIPAHLVDGGGRGGVAVLVKEPLALSHVHQSTGTWGQLLVCELLGHAMPITVCSGYRRPDGALDSANEAILSGFAKAQHRHWILGVDWNSSPYQGPFHDLMGRLGGSVAAVSGHRTSSTPTDSSWISGSLSCDTAEVLAPLSDHFGSCVSLSRLPFLHATPPALTFQKVAPLLPDSEWPSLSKEQAEAEWTKVTPSVSAWQQLLRETPEASWKAWSSAPDGKNLCYAWHCA